MAELLVRAEAETSPHHGRAPAERPVPDLLRLGCILLDKPSGPSSHQVAAWVRQIFRAGKAGHGGTLDPHVTGVLPIALDDATKALSALKDQDKVYVGVVEFHAAVEPKQIEAAAQLFTGEIFQKPPLRSAVVRRLRTRRIDRLDVQEIDGRRALIRVECQGGTYVRKLATDLGTYLGVGAHLAELRRVKSAHLGEDRAVGLHAIKDAWEEWHGEGREDWLRSVVLPVEAFLSQLPRVVVRDTAVDAICHGAPLGVPGVLQVSREILRGDNVLVATLKGEAVALGVAEMGALQMVMDQHGLAARPSRIIMRAGTYPKGW